MEYFSIIIFGIMGFFIGLFLMICSVLLKNDKKDINLVDKVFKLLPKIDCGSCGYSGCRTFAESVVDQKEKPSKCIISDEKNIRKILKIMGLDDNLNVNRKIAYIKCIGSYDLAKKRYDYEGIKDCRAVSNMYQGDKLCKYSCLGYGNCINVCRYNAIYIDNGVAKINPKKCVGCGECIKVCPRNLIELYNFEDEFIVSCSSEDKISNRVKVCSVGCIACGLCVKKCPNHAIKIIKNMAVIDQSKCNKCGLCVEVCPKNIIIKEKKDFKKIVNKNDKKESKCLNCNLCK
jgi:Na+-translocating ferredoxin:NAD+ oxidoreductase subunit B